MTEASRSWLRMDLSLRPGQALSPEDVLGLCSEALADLDCLGLEELPEREGLARVAVYFPLGTGGEAVSDALDTVPGVTLEAVSSLQDPGWVQQFNESLDAVNLGRKFTILPRPGLVAPPGRLGLVIEAGLAFGTGHHETTSLAIEWLEERVQPGHRVVDVGTGTGILAAVAILLGASSVLAVDNDEEALPVARHTLAQLPHPEQVELLLAEDPATLPPGQDVVVVNIIAGISLPMLPALCGLLTPTGSLIISGLLLRDEEEADGLLRSLGLQPSWKRDGEWCSAEAHA